MSFGFSVGDFIAAASLIRNITSALNGAAASEYRELELELHGLQRALHEIEHLEPLPGKEAELNAVKVAALMCCHPLEEFQTKLNKFQRLSPDTQPKRSDVVKGWGQKLQWNLCMPDEVQKLRAYLAAHTGSLNMRLATLSLATMGVRNSEAAQTGSFIQSRLENQTSIIRESTQRVDSVYALVAGKVVPQLQNLIDIATKVWTSNVQTMNYFSRMQDMHVKIDTRHTWFQDPIRLQDAFGREIPIPAEYGWSTMQAVIRDRFSSGPGYEKVQAGEYELFCTTDSSQLITEETARLLRPGSNITMAMIVGMYVYMEDMCPRPGCVSKDFSTSKDGGMTCEKCKTWFELSRRTLPRPFRWFAFEDIQREFSDESKESRKRKRTTESTSNAERNIFREMREQRKWYKNLRIHHTELSTVVSVLEQQWQLKSAMQAKKAKISTSPKENWKPDGFTQIWTGALQILVEELEVEPEDLQDSAVFTDLGLDSLLLMSVLSRMRDELSLEIHPSALQGALTVGDFWNFLQSSCNDGKSVAPEDSANVPHSDILDLKWAGILRIIAEESGLETDKLGDDVELVGLGIDSLLIIIICGRVRKEIDENFTLGPLSIYSQLRELRDLIISPRPFGGSCSRD